MSGMDDLISRQAAIDALGSRLDRTAKGEIGSFYNTIIQRDIECIERLPNAQPERKNGKWIIYIVSMFDGEGCKCSECGFEGAPYWDFCPSCGSRNEVGR